jgi:hypothetical protein
MHEELKMTGIKRIVAERQRQIDKEGWSEKHDSQHKGQELAWAAVCYAAPDSVFKRSKHSQGYIFYDPWPWDQRWDNRNKHNRIRQLEIAGALCAAEIDRLLAEAKRETK